MNSSSTLQFSRPSDDKLLVSFPEDQKLSHKLSAMSMALEKLSRNIAEGTKAVSQKNK